MVLKLAVLTSVWKVSIFVFHHMWSMTYATMILSTILGPVSPTLLSRPDGSVQFT